MAQLVNTTTNQIEEVPQDQLHENLTSGKYNLVKGDSVNVINPSGQLVSLPAEQVPEALQSNFKFASQNDITQYENKQKYEQPLEQAKTFGEGVASGATFGASRELEKALSNNSEEQKLRSEINPGMSLAGELTGGIGSMIVAPELSPVGMAANVGRGVTGVAEAIGTKAASALANPETSPIFAKLLKSAVTTGSKTLGSAVEGAAYGLGNAVQEHALGDADLNAENILHNVGYGALFGGALGATIGSVESGYRLVNPAVEKAALKDSIIENAANAVDVPILERPGSIEEIAKRVTKGKDIGLMEDLPQKQALLEAEQVLAGDSQFPAHELQTQSLESKFARDYFKTFMESGSENAQHMQAWEALQKKEGVQLTKKFIQEIAPESRITEDAVDAGNKVVKAFKEQDKIEREALKPYFKEFDEKAVQSIKDPEVVIGKINEALPQAEEYIYKTPAGYDVQKYQSSMPFSKETHTALKDLLTQISKPDLTLGGLRNIREAMRDKINFLTAPRVSREISGLRKATMDIIQDEVGTLSNDVQVRDLFKRWAINEENKQVMEQIFGGSINDAATFAKTIKPEDVLSKMFSNTVSVKAAKEILGDKFNSISADYLAQNMAKYTDVAKNGFSSNKMASLLKAKAPELEEALSQRPEQLAKLRAITDKMRILPDSPSVNTSGTAKTSLYQKMQQMTGYLTEHGLSQIPTQALKKVAEHFEQASQTRGINEVLSGRARLDDLAQKRSRYDAFTKIERMGQETSKTINRLSNDIFKFETPVKGLIIQKLTPEETQKKYDKISKKVREMASNFNNQMDSLETATAPLTGVAPTISASLNMSAAKATQFLASKLPPVEDSGPFSQAHKPSSSDVARFNRYYATVEKPLDVLKHMKAGTLTPESMEALKSVYPKLYNEMSNTLMDKVTAQINKDNKAVPYKTKIMLSMFFGQDMSNSLKQQNIAETQQILASQNQPKPGQQPKSAFSKLDQSNQALTDMQKTEAS